MSRTVSCDDCPLLHVPDVSGDITKCRAGYSIYNKSNFLMEIGSVSLDCKLKVIIHNDGSEFRPEVLSGGDE